MNYDLEERTRKFSKEVIKFLKTVKLNHINQPLASQLVRSATTVLGRTTAKQMQQVQKTILGIKYTFVEKRFKRQNIGWSCLLNLILNRRVT